MKSNKKMICYVNTNQKEVGLPTFISEKENFRERKTIRNKDGRYIIKGKFSRKIL